MVDDDPVRRRFLRRQLNEARDLAAQSDVLDLCAFGPDEDAPVGYRVAFHCIGALRSRGGSIDVARTRFEVGVLFAPDYLRRVDVFQLVTWLAPVHVANPHIAPPLICLGRVHPGTPLVDLAYRIFETITFFNWAPADPLNRDPAVAAWAAANRDRFPLDRAPLRRPRRPVLPPGRGV